MWANFVENLDLPDWDMQIIVFEKEESGEILDGLILNRKNTGDYMIIQEGILDTLNDEIADWERRSEFLHMYQGRLEGIRIDPTHMENDLPVDDNKILQRTHHDAESVVYDKNLSNSPYGKGSDQFLFSYWAEELIRGVRILDLGCGTGRRGLQAIKRTQAPYFGVDISFGMIKKARKKFQDAGLLGYANFCAGDVETHLIKPNSVDVVLATGVLHHATNPRNIIQRAKEALIPGGIFLSYENNASRLRDIFDWLQKIVPTWHEEAGTYHIISAAQIIAWFGEVGGFEEPVFKYHIFLPPQAYNLFGESLGASLMQISDSIGRNLPYCKENAGILIINARLKS